MSNIVDGVLYEGTELGRFGSNCKFSKTPEWLDQVMLNGILRWNYTYSKLYYIPVFGSPVLINVGDSIYLEERCNNLYIGLCIFGGESPWKK